MQKRLRMEEKLLQRQNQLANDAKLLTPHKNNVKEDVDVSDSGCSSGDTNTPTASSGSAPPSVWLTSAHAASAAFTPTKQHAARNGCVNNSAIRNSRRTMEALLSPRLFSKLDSSTNLVEHNNKSRRALSSSAITADPERNDNVLAILNGHYHNNYNGK